MSYLDRSWHFKLDLKFTVLVHCELRVVMGERLETQITELGLGPQVTHWNFWTFRHGLG